MKTNEMLNDYVMNHKLGENGQREFVQDFINAIRNRTMNLFLMDEAGNITIMDKER